MSDNYLKQEEVTYKEDGIGWVLIPPTVMADSELNNSQKMLMGRIMGLVKKKGYCYASNGWLGNQLDLSPKTVSNYIEKLREEGFVKREIIKNDNDQVKERRIYPQISNTPPIHNNMDTPPHKYVEGSVRDNSVRDNNYNITPKAVIDSADILADKYDLNHDKASNFGANDFISIHSKLIKDNYNINWKHDGGYQDAIHKVTMVRKAYFDGDRALTAEYIVWAVLKKFESWDSVDSIGWLTKAGTNEFKKWRRDQLKSEELEKQIDAGAPEPDESVNSMEDARNLMG